MKLRLMGLRCTNLVSTKRVGVDFFGILRHRTSTNGDEPSSNKAFSSEEDGIWEVWPEAEFEEAARQEREDEMNELERLSQEDYVGDTFQQRQHALDSTRGSEVDQERLETHEDFWDCPICDKPQKAHDRDFNEHIDHCLSRQTIKEAVKDVPIESVDQPLSSRVQSTTARNIGSRKRKSPFPNTHEREKRLFFGAR